MRSGALILLATHNGGQYLEEQLDSLLAQTVHDWTLLIGDDLSVDDTPNIIESYTGRDERIETIDDSTSGIGSPAANFGRLMQAAQARGAAYVFFCDQDDIWLPNKLEIMLEGLREAEITSDRPCLLHHDLEVVDSELNPIADSFMQLMRLEPGDEQNPQRILSRNEVTGCALACNRALLEIALPIPEEAIMHDWWLALHAAYFGYIGYLPHSLVRYRQHGANIIGAKSFWHGLNPLNNWIRGWQSGNQEFLETVAQARAFREAMEDLPAFDLDKAEAVRLYCELPGFGPLERLKVLRKCGLWRKHWILNSVLVLRLLLLPRNSA